MTTDAEIVTALANLSPIAASETNGDLYCVLCDAEEQSTRPPSSLNLPANHEPTCPWRMAREARAPAGL